MDMLGVAEAEAAIRTAAWVASIGLNTASNGSGIVGLSFHPFDTEIARFCNEGDDDKDPDGSACAAVNKRSRTVNGVLTAGSGGGRPSRAGQVGQQGSGTTPRPAATSAKRQPLRRACTERLRAHSGAGAAAGLATGTSAHHPLGFSADVASGSTSRYVSQGLTLTAALKLAANQQSARRMRVSAGAVAPPAQALGGRSGRALDPTSAGSFRTPATLREAREGA